MRNKRLGPTGAGRLAVLAALLTAVCMLAVPVCAATVTASDVMIRNSGEERDDNIIGVLQEGDKVTVISKSTDSAGIEWYYIKLPNKNTGYVKAQWIDNGGEDVETVQSEPAESPEETQEEEEPQDAEDSAAQAGEEEARSDEGYDDWTREDTDQSSVPDQGEGTEEQDGTGSEEGAEEGDSQNQPQADAGTAYDPYTDPSAQYSINFVTEKDGTGNWYIYNYDTDKHIRIGDLDKLSDAQNAAQKSASSAGIWRTIACILLLLLIALLVLLYLFMRRNGGGRPGPSPRRARRQRRIEDDDEDDDEFSYDWGEEAEESPVSADDSGPESPLPETEGAAAGARTVDVFIPDDEDGPAPDEADAPAEEEEEPETSGTAKSRGGLFGAIGGKGSKKQSRYAEEDYGEDEDLDDGDEYYDDEEYDDYGDGDDYDEDDYEEDDEDYEDDEPRSGGVFGFLKKIFSSDGLEDDYEDEEDEDDYEDDEDSYGEEDGEAEDYEEEGEEEELPPRRGGRQKGRSAVSARSPRPRPRQSRTIEFDEALDYPEDADLLPAGLTDPAETRADAGPEQAAGGPAARTRDVTPGPAAGARGTARQTAAAPAYGPEEDPDDSPDDFFADDDDDMEYSFLSSPRKRSRDR